MEKFCEKNLKSSLFSGQSEIILVICGRLEIAYGALKYLSEHNNKSITSSNNCGGEDKNNGEQHKYKLRALMKVSQMNSPFLSKIKKINWIHILYGDINDEKFISNAVRGVNHIIMILEPTLERFSAAYEELAILAKSVVHHVQKFVFVHGGILPGCSNENFCHSKMINMLKECSFASLIDIQVPFTYESIINLIVPNTSADSDNNNYNSNVDNISNTNGNNNNNNNNNNNSSSSNNNNNNNNNNNSSTIISTISSNIVNNTNIEIGDNNEEEKVAADSNSFIMYSPLAEDTKIPLISCIDLGRFTASILIKALEGKIEGHSFCPIFELSTLFELSRKLSKCFKLPVTIEKVGFGDFNTNIIGNLNRKINSNCSSGITTTNVFFGTEKSFRDIFEDSFRWLEDKEKECKSFTYFKDQLESFEKICQNAFKKGAKEHMETEDLYQKDQLRNIRTMKNATTITEKTTTTITTLSSEEEKIVQQKMVREESSPVDYTQYDMEKNDEEIKFRDEYSNINQNDLNGKKNALVEDDDSNKPQTTKDTDFREQNELNKKSEHSENSYSEESSRSQEKSFEEQLSSAENKALNAECQESVSEKLSERVSTTAQPEFCIKDNCINFD